MGVIPEITLSSGGKIPVIGLGTATYPTPPQEVVETAVLEAIKLGYRHFDTASIYESEEPLGHAIARALEDGTVIGSRQELFVTSKLFFNDTYPEGVIPALRETLRKLGLEYVDLYLVHWPIRLSGERRMEFTGDDIIPFDMRGTWEAMEECHRLGLAKAIGVSNFTCKKIDQLLEHAKIPPAVNQVEMHPLWQDKKLRDFCSEKGIHVSAYSPLGGPAFLWGRTSPAVLESEVIKRIAQSIGKTPAQVCLRFGFEKGVSILPKSFNKQRMKENMEIFDWQLCDEDMEELNQLPQARTTNVSPYISQNGIFKSHYEFWDGEI